MLRSVKMTSYKNSSNTDTCFTQLPVMGSPTPSTGDWTQGLHLEPLFCDFFSQDRVSQIVCLGWPRTTILLISTTWVARITGMNHQHPVYFFVCFFETESCNVAQVGLKLSIILPQSSEYWDYRCVPPWLAFPLLRFKYYHLWSNMFWWTLLLSFLLHFKMAITISPKL
jgi:hypothetical protein